MTSRAGSSASAVAEPRTGERTARIVTRGLSKKYRGGVLAARDIAIEAFDGEIVGVVGPNGAGKSTILKMLATLIAPTSGSASVCGHPLQDVGKVRPLLGVALQDMGLDPLMTGAEHFAVQAAISGHRLLEVEARKCELINRLSLGPYVNKSVGSYSGGTQRRLALALALLGDPLIIIFDEPTAGLDPRARRDVWSVLEQLRAEGHTVLLSTQYLEEADRLCDRIYLIDHGSIVAAGRPEDLKAELGRSTFEVSFESGYRVDSEALFSGLPVTVESGDAADLPLRFDRSKVAVDALLRRLDSQRA